MKKKFTIIISLSLVILTSCKKDFNYLTQSTRNETNTIFLKETRMSFKDVNQVEQAYNEYN